MKYTLQHNNYQGNQPLVIDLPEDWDVEYHGIPGDQEPTLTKAQIHEKLNAPYGSKTLSELALGRKEVVIAFDDMSRGTPIRPIAEAVLEELHAAGIQKEQIRFICAAGAHAALTRRDFVKKLGEEIVSNYRIYNHNCYENTVCIGKTKSGFEVYINKEFMDCDLRIGIGGIVPHPFNSFGGGGKLLFPGLASIETMANNHKTATDFLRERNLNNTEKMGDLTMSGMREEVEEMARMVGQFFKIDAIFNTKLELIDLYAGDVVEEYYAAIPSAQKNYVAKRPVNKDVVIVNVNAKCTEASIAAGVGALGIRPEGGDVVLVDQCEMGQVTHYLFGTFGKESAGRMYGKVNRNRPQVNRLICMMPKDIGSKHWYGDAEKQIYADNWEEVLALLKETHGVGTKVSILADGTIMYFPQQN